MMLENLIGLCLLFSYIVKDFNVDMIILILN
jgi:hypothetical protein